MARVRAALDGPVYAVLGNHDWIETVPPMEAAGIRFLLNEGVRLERGGAALWLAGVDDPHFYEADNLEKAVAGVGRDETVVLLCHTPELFRQAAFGGVDLMLCGHTHGGQLCLPGGRAVLTNARAPRLRRVRRVCPLQLPARTGAPPPAAGARRGGLSSPPSGSPPGSQGNPHGTALRVRFSAFAF